MKKILVLLSAVVALTSCGPQPVYVEQQPTVVAAPDPYVNQGYEVLQQGNQQVVYVNNGREQFYMDLLLFNSLMNSGGWGSVYGRYRSNPSYYYNPGYVNRYRSYRHTTINHYNYSSSNYYKSRNYTGNTRNAARSVGGNVNQRPVYQQRTSSPSRSSSNWFSRSSSSSSKPSFSSPSRSSSSSSFSRSSSSSSRSSSSPSKRK